MIINGRALLSRFPIENMIPTKENAHGVSHGLSEVGYDIRLKQRVVWTPPDPVKALQIYTEDYVKTSFDKAFHGYTEVFHEEGSTIRIGRCLIASTIEKFNIPGDLWCEFRNKSTHARCFVDASLGTDGEPGWEGYLTVEIVFHGLEPIELPAGSGIMKAVFHELKNPSSYKGKYQNQPDRPVPAIKE